MFEFILKRYRSKITDRDNTLSAYLPSDRLFGLSHRQMLPDPTTGAALFVDISGFTLLTEQLTQMLGARRGVEELAHRDFVR